MTLPDHTEPAAARVAVEHLIARYPDLSPDEVTIVLGFLRHGASAMDRATIAANPALHDQYRRLGRDHHLDGLRPVEWVFAMLAVAGLMLAIYLAHALAETI